MPQHRHECSPQRIAEETHKRLCEEASHLRTFLHDEVSMDLLFLHGGQSVLQNSVGSESDSLPDVSHEHGNAKPFPGSLPLEEQVCSLWEVLPFTLMPGKPLRGQAAPEKQGVFAVLCS